MSIILTSVLVVGTTYDLTTLPRVDNAIWQMIPQLKLHDLFVYKGIEGSSHRFQHTATGKIVILQAVFFLNSDRFYYAKKGSTTEKTALFVSVPAKARETLGKRIMHAQAGTVFSEYREDKVNKKFIITANNGVEYSVHQTSCIRICDIESEDKKPEPKVPAALPVVEDASLSFTRQVSVTLNGMEFSSVHDADAAENLIREMHTLINSVQFTTSQDAINAFKLAKILGAFG